MEIDAQMQIAEAAATDSRVVTKTQSASELPLSGAKENSRRLELSISKNTPHGRSAKGPGQCGPNVRGRFAFPGARNPRI